MGLWRHQGGCWKGHGELGDPKTVDIWETDERDKYYHAVEDHLKEENDELEMYEHMDSLEIEAGGRNRALECSWMAENVTARLCPGETAWAKGKDDLCWPDSDDDNDVARRSSFTMSPFTGSTAVAALPIPRSASQGRASSFSSPGGMSYISPVKAEMNPACSCQACVLS